MFKARWRSDKSKIKAVFKLRLELVEIPRSGWESLVVSLVPVDVGRSSVRSGRSEVVDGTCTWERAIFETVKLSRDSKTGKIDEKVYRFLVSGNEFPKGRVLGEALFDFANYTESIKPSLVSLQLKGGANSSAVLHLTVQRMQEDGIGRESEDRGNGQQKRALHHHPPSNGHDAEADGASNGINATAVDFSANGKAQLKFHSSRGVVVHAEPTESLTKSQSFDASSAISTESGSERNTPRDTQLRNIKFEKNRLSSLSPLRNSDSLPKTSSPLRNLDSLPKTTYNSSSDAVVTSNGERWGSNTEWSPSSVPDESLDGSTNGSEDAGSRDRIQESDAVEKLRQDVVSLSRQVEVSELELQALRKQVVKERRQGDDLSKEVSFLREENDSLRRKCELLKASHYEIGNEKVRSSPDGEDQRSLLEETKRELVHEKSLNATLSLQIQKMQESNSELILAVKDLEQLLEEKSGESVHPKCEQVPEMPMKVEQRNGIPFPGEKSEEELVGTHSEHEEDEQLQVLVKDSRDPIIAVSLEQRISELSAEVELYKKDRDDIEMQMEQLALDYEILKQESHDIATKYEQSQLREQLRMQYECSAHVSIINDLEAQVANLENELLRQESMFEEDLATVTKAKIEQEQRAIRAEASLESSKQNNVAATERLQDQFRKLSSQMSTTFDSNEKLAKKAMMDVRQERLQKMHLEQLVDKAREELASTKNQFMLQLKELLDQVDLKTIDVQVLELKLKDKTEELENQWKLQQSKERDLSGKISILNSEIEKLTAENFELSKQINGELKMMSEKESLQKLIQERDRLLQDGSIERDGLCQQLESARGDLSKSREEQQNLERSIKDKELDTRNLRSDLEILRAQYNGLTKSFLEGQMEKENLREQVRNLKRLNSAPIEDESSTDISNERAGTVDVLQPENGERPHRDPTPSPASVSDQTDELLREMDGLKERNQSMEEELREMQGRYLELSLKFAEVEGERQQLVMRVRSLKHIAKS